jgi:perosamine synthetase
VIVAQGCCTEAVAEIVETRATSSPVFDMKTLALFMGYGLATNPAGWWLLSRTPWNPADAGMQMADLEPINLGRLSAVQAGIGASILERLELIQRLGRQHAQQLISMLSPFGFLRVPQVAPQAEPVFLRLPVLVEGEERARRLFTRLSEAGIGVSRSYWRTIPDLFADSHPANRKDFPGAERLASCLLTLPTHCYLTEADFDRLVAVLKTAD